MGKEPSSRLAELAKKYNHEIGRPAEQEAVQVSFDKEAVQKDMKRLERLSQEPKLKDPTTTGELHAELAELHLDLANLADKYGKLNVKLKDVIGKESIYSLGEVIALAFHKLPVIGSKNRRKEIMIQAARRRGDLIERLVEAMSEVLNEQYQRAIEGKTRSKEMQIENVAHMKTLDKKLIDSLKGGYSGGADLTTAQQEIKKLEKELDDIDAVLGEYEKDVQTAKAAGDIDKVNELTYEMGEVLDIKHGVLDGKLAADGIVSEIRRKMLDSAEATQSAKGATAASKVNYQAINALTDAMNELEIKYHHALEDMIPVFKIQGKIAAVGQSALDLHNTLREVSAISGRLMDTNAKLVMHLAAETFELLKTPLYDVEKAKQIEGKIKDYMTKLNENKRAWAENQQRLTEVSTTPHYAKHK